MGGLSGWKPNREPRPVAGDRAAAHDLAVTFIADTAGATGPWQVLFEGWADERRLPLSLRREIRIAVLRGRCFGRP